MMQDEVWQEILLACIGEQFQSSLNQGKLFYSLKTFFFFLIPFLDKIFLIVGEFLNIFLTLPS